jgi:hypothetical protein
MTPRPARVGNSPCRTAEVAGACRLVSRVCRPHRQSGDLGGAIADGREIGGSGRPAGERARAGLKTSSSLAFRLDVDSAHADFPPPARRQRRRSHLSVRLLRAVRLWPGNSGFRISNSARRCGGRPDSCPSPAPQSARRQGARFLSCGQTANDERIHAIRSSSLNGLLR